MRRYEIKTKAQPKELPKGDFGTSATTIERGGQKYVPITDIKEFICGIVIDDMEKDIDDFMKGRADAIKEIYKFIDSL